MRSDTSGQKRVFDYLVPWGRQAAYRVRRFSDWFWTKRDGGSQEQPIKGGEIKSVGKLAFVSVDEAGHLPMVGQPEAVAFIVECWTTGTARRDGACPEF